MNLENPKKFKLLVDQALETALNVLRPISRKYDKSEHAYPKELDMLASLVDGMNEGGDGMNAGAAVNKRGDTEAGNKNGVNMSTALSVIEMCYGDTGLVLSMPRQGLGNSAIAAVANDEQLERSKVHGQPWRLLNLVVGQILLPFVPQQRKMDQIIFSMEKKSL